jgi:hypothetical protein
VSRGRTFRTIYTGGPPPAGGFVAAGVDTVAFAVASFDGTSGTKSISNGIPFPPGYVTEAMIASRQVRVFVGGVEKSCYVEALGGRHSDGSVKVCLVQFSQTGVSGTPLTGEIQLGTTRGTSDIAKQALDTQPTTLAWPTSTTFLTAANPFWQPLVPMSQRPTGGAWDTWESLFRDRMEQWGDYAGTNPDWGLLYGGSGTYPMLKPGYEFALMTGEPVWLYHGRRIYDVIRTQYVNPNSWTFNESRQVLILDALTHYWLTGDPLSRSACADQCNNPSIIESVSASQLADRTYGNNHGRVHFANLAPLVVGHHLGYTPVPTTDEAAAGATWALKATAVANAALTQQFTDGHNTWPSATAEYPTATQQNWQVFLRSAALFMHEAWVASITGLEAHVQAGYDYIDADWWSSTNGGWAIANFTGFSGDGSPDLNGFGLETVAWLYRQTSDAALVTRGDAAVAGLVANGYWTFPPGGVAGRYVKQIAEMNFGIMAYIGARQGA